MNCIIVDDEPLAREGIKTLLKTHKAAKVIALCKDIIDLKLELKNNTVDVIFLDINMPVTSGIEFLQNTNIDIPVILTTAHHEYALEAFELNVVDYLVKPISQARFDQAFEKLSEYLQFKRYTQNDSKYCFIKCDKVQEKVYYEDILYIEALRNYVVFYLHDRRLIHYASISSIVDKLPSTQFARVHKSYIVALNKVSAYAKNTIVIGTAQIPVSRKIKSEIDVLLQKKGMNAGGL
jgi:DNA-binding LytR/AlgR family response regulator